MDTMISPLQLKALQAGEKVHHRFEAVQTLDYREGWVMEEVTKAPVIVSKRLKTLETNGIKVRRIYIAHEAPKLLNAPKEEPVKQDSKITPILPELTTLLVGVAAVFVALFVRAILIDPACVVELEDGSLVEVMSWYP